LSCEDFINLLSQVTELKTAIEKLSPILRENAITGRVLLYCDLNELKSVLKLNFGNWEIFKLLILSLRDIENNAKNIPSVKTDNRDLNDGASGNQTQQQPQLRMKQKSVIEKQVCKSI
jgi:ankyrin repeat-rich membrane spanning protein